MKKIPLIRIRKISKVPVCTYHTRSFVEFAKFWSDERAVENETNISNIRIPSLHTRACAYTMHRNISFLLCEFINVQSLLIRVRVYRHGHIYDTSHVTNDVECKQTPHHPPTQIEVIAKTRYSHMVLLISAD
jgi:hypothetical protein